MEGKIAVIDRGGNTFYEKAQHAITAGATGVIFVDSDDRLSSVPEHDGDPFQLPCVLVRKSWLKPGIRVGSVCTITLGTMGPSGTIDFQTIVEGWNDAGTKFEDPSFPASLMSLFFNPRSPPPQYFDAHRATKIVWKRPEDLHSDPVLFDQDAIPNDIIQGDIGDCYFLSAAAILCSDAANTKAKDILKKLFIKTQYFRDGLVGVRFFKDGHWLDVAIDTRIAMAPNKYTGKEEPAFVRMKDSNEFWVIMLEKAYAKLHGSYEILDGGSIEDALADMTGAAPGRVGMVELQLAASVGGHVDRMKAMHLLEKRAHGELFQGASCDGGSEEAIGNGLYAGHAYSINAVKKTSTGEILVCLRNPWGRLEWGGAWSDNDTARWTPALKAEMGFTACDDGTFWMSITDFLKHFTTCTFVDMVPPSFHMYRAHSQWTPKSAGGCYPNHNTWANNPQIHMRVSKPTEITISLSQPDNKMNAGRQAKETYDYALGFVLFRGAKRRQRWSQRDVVKETDSYGVRRTVSLTWSKMEKLPAGDYVIVPSTFDPAPGLAFHLGFWSSEDIQLNGGQEWQIFNASMDQLDKQNVPLTIEKGMAPPETAEVESPSSAADEVHEQRVRCDADEIHFDFGGMVEDFKAVDKSAWKVGSQIPSGWEEGTEYTKTAESKFFVGELVAIQRSDGTVRFGKISEGSIGCPGKHALGVAVAAPGWTCDVCNKQATPGENLNDCRICDWDACEECRVRQDQGKYQIEVGTSQGVSVTKNGVPPEYIGKIQSSGGIPQGLRDKISCVFDVLDADGSGFLEVTWDAKELANDVGKRLLAEMKVPKGSRADMYSAMRSLDADGDGKISREEFVQWFAKKSMTA